MFINRRKFILIIIGILFIPLILFTKKVAKGAKKAVKTCLIGMAHIDQKISPPRANIIGQSTVAISRNGTPQQNLRQAISMLGGIERFIGKKDIVIVKPNLQWWNQGRTNLAAIKAFIDLVIEINDFSGEVIIAENIHFMDDALPDLEKDNIRGWTQISEINGDIDGVNHNVNTLIDLYRDAGFNNVSKVHWRDGGQKRNFFGSGQNGGLTTDPHSRDGYYWAPEAYTFTGFFGLKQWTVKMSYPIFTSPFSGITIDFKNGPFRRHKNAIEAVTGRSVRLINFAAFNTHGDDTGITGAVKNYMGITDMSCGYWGMAPENYSNVHFCGDRYYTFAKAGPIGHFIKTIKKADLNILTAEWIGWGSRTDISKAHRARSVLAGTDPFALDYVGAKHILLPTSKNSQLHDPDNPHSPTSKYLATSLNSCGEGTVDPHRITIEAYDFSRKDHTQTI